MKSKTQPIEQNRQINIPDWIFQEVQEDDFLMGKTPKDLEDSWEEEE